MIMINGQFSSRETTQADYNTDNIYILFQQLMITNRYDVDFVFINVFKKLTKMLFISFGCFIT